VKKERLSIVILTSSPNHRCNNNLSKLLGGSEEITLNSDEEQDANRIIEDAPVDLSELMCQLGQISTNPLGP